MIKSMENWQRQLVEFWNSHEPYFEGFKKRNCICSKEHQAAFQFVPSKGRVLDIACGNGANGVTLEQRADYWGMDLSLLAISNCVCKSVGHMVCGDVHHLPFQNETFDVVMGTCVLEHFFFPKIALREMYNVVRPGGRMILLGPCWDLPYWFPPSAKHRMSSLKERVWYSASRFWGQIQGWLGGPMPFYGIEQPEVLARGYRCDEDVVYVVWIYEVINLMKDLGARCIHLALDDKFPGRHFLSRLMKKALYLLPIYQCGGGFLAVFEKS